MVNIHLLNKQYFCDKNTEGLSNTSALESVMWKCGENTNWLPSVGGIFKEGHTLYG